MVREVLKLHVKLSSCLKSRIARVRLASIATEGGRENEREREREREPIKNNRNRTHTETHTEAQIRLLNSAHRCSSRAGIELSSKLPCGARGTRLSSDGKVPRRSHNHTRKEAGECCNAARRPTAYCGSCTIRERDDAKDLGLLVKAWHSLPLLCWRTKVVRSQANGSKNPKLRWTVQAGCPVDTFLRLKSPNLAVARALALSYPSEN